MELVICKRGIEIRPNDAYETSAVPLVGLKLVIVATPVLVKTVKFAALVADPFGLVTEIGPVVAEVGAVTWSWLFVAEETVAAVPLNVTVF